LINGKNTDSFLKNNPNFGDALSKSYALNALYRDQIPLMGESLTVQEREEMMKGVPAESDCF